MAQRVDAAALFAAIPADRYAEAEARAARHAPPSPTPFTPRERTPEQRQLDRDAKRLFDAIPDEFYGAFETPGSSADTPAELEAVVPDPLPQSAPQHTQQASKPKPDKQRFARLRFRWP